MATICCNVNFIIILWHFIKFSWRSLAREWAGGLYCRQHWCAHRLPPPLLISRFVRAKCCAIFRYIIIPDTQWSCIHCCGGASAAPAGEKMASNVPFRIRRAAIALSLAGPTGASWFGVKWFVEIKNFIRIMNIITEQLILLSTQSHN